MPAITNASSTSHLQDISKTLEEWDLYLRKSAWRKVPTTIAHPELLDMEADELAQRERIKLWQALRQTYIINLRAYINCIVNTESITMVRSHKPICSLSVNDEGEIYSGHILIAASQGTLDPALEFEHKEDVYALLAETVDAIVTLPPRQQRAIICELKDQLEGVLPVAEAFRKRGFNIDAINWPEDREDRTRLKASLSEVRKKLSFLRSAKRRYSANC